MAWLGVAWDLFRIDFGEDEMPYLASRGGHAPGHLREAFMACVDEQFIGQRWWEALAREETLEFFDPKKQAAWECLTLRERATWLTGQLWNCSDILGGEYCQLLDLPLGSTYARAVRKLRQDLD
jgi:hypothetical protein